MGPASVSTEVLCQLVHLAGSDLAVLGMYGGAEAVSLSKLQERRTALQTTFPIFAGGMSVANEAQLAHRMEPGYGVLYEHRGAV